MTAPGNVPRRLPRGLYAITPDWPDTDRLRAAVTAALLGGARVLQYRNKLADSMLRMEQARALRSICREFDVPLIVNDDLELALAIDADGLHLGSDDGSLAYARASLGASRLLGASCYNSLERAHAALAAGADHVAFGAAYSSTTKPSAVRAELALYRQARRLLACPIVAIGGITLGNAPLLIAAGVDAVAAISAVFDAPDIAKRALQFAAAFEHAP